MCCFCCAYKRGRKAEQSDSSSEHGRSFRCAFAGALDGAAEATLEEEELVVFVLEDGGRRCWARILGSEIGRCLRGRVGLS